YCFVIACGCEKGFFSFKGRQCVKLFEAKATYQMAEMVCKNYGNATIAWFEDIEEVEFYRLITYNVLNIKNNVWVNGKFDENYKHCACLTESEESVQFFNCDEKHSFLCKQQSKQENRLSLEDVEKLIDRKFNKLQEAIEMQRINLTTEIEKLKTLHLGISTALAVSENADNSSNNLPLTSSVMQRFFYISEKIDKCAGKYHFASLMGFI
ncbi:hypothetical protein B4U80_11929, partial [Leptotrombidium deliense]